MCYPGLIRLLQAESLEGPICDPPHTTMWVCRARLNYSLLGRCKQLGIVPASAEEAIVRNTFLRLVCYSCLVLMATSRLVGSPRFLPPTCLTSRLVLVLIMPTWTLAVL